MAGFIIIPACFAYGVEPDAGPSLLFITLPNVLNNMSGGRIWGTCFFVFMSFAALSTVIAVFENIMSFWLELTNLSRTKIAIINIFLLLVLSIPAAFNYSIFSSVKIFGMDIMGFEDSIVSNFILPFGSLVSIGAIFLRKRTLSQISRKAG